MLTPKRLGDVDVVTLGDVAAPAGPQAYEFHIGVAIRAAARGAAGDMITHYPAHQLGQ
jgi:hypothetical protein